MAERRMFTKEITNSSEFIKMPSSTQALYFHLNMNSDDDGFCNEVDTCMFRAKASEDDLKVLLAKKFILAYEDSSVIVIKHWRMNNLLRKDRYHETKYQEEKERLFLKENGSYTFNSNEGKPLISKPKKVEEIECEDSWQPNGNQMATEISIGKDRLGKDSIVEYSKDKDINKEEKIDKEIDVHTHEDSPIYRKNLIRCLDYLDSNSLNEEEKNKLIAYDHELSIKQIEFNDDEQELYGTFKELMKIKIYDNTDNEVMEDDLPF